MRFSLFVLGVLFLNVSALADGEICIEGGRRLSIEKTFMELKLPLDGKSEKRDYPVEHVLGSVQKDAYFRVLGFYTFDQMKKKFCQGTVSDFPVIYYPSYERVIGQNGFYWYLKQFSQVGKVTHLFLHSGWVRDGQCVPALEGADYYVVSCN